MYTFYVREMGRMVGYVHAPEPNIRRVCAPCFIPQTLKARTWTGLLLVTVLVGLTSRRAGADSTGWGVGCE